MELSQRRSRYQSDYVWLAAGFAVVMVLTNMIGTKLFALFPTHLPTGFGWLSDGGPVILTTGIISYPLTFLLTDVVSEVWGKAAANRMVLLGFAASVLMVVAIQIGVRVPAADRYWSDASGNLLGSVNVAQDLGVGSSQIPIDDAAYLPAGLGLDGTLRLAAQEADGRWSLMKVQAIASSGGGFAQPWHQHALLLQGQLTRPLPAGTRLVPVVEIAPGLGGVLRVDRPLLLPPRGSLVALDGSRSWTYAQRDDDGKLKLSDPPSQPVLVAVVATASPALMQRAFEATFSLPGILLFASMLAYLVAQLVDVWLFHVWRDLTKGRHLWLRNNGSTALSQLVDTIIVNGIFLPLAFGLGFQATATVIACIYVCKLVLALLDTPFCYLAVWLAKRRLGVAFTTEVPAELSRP